MELSKLATTLDAYSPLATLNRGYAIVCNHKGNIVKKIEEIECALHKMHYGRTTTRQTTTTNNNYSSSGSSTNRGAISATAAFGAVARCGSRKMRFLSIPSCLPAFLPCHNDTFKSVDKALSNEMQFVQFMFLRTISGGSESQLLGIYCCVSSGAIR